MPAVHRLQSTSHRRGSIRTGIAVVAPAAACGGSAQGSPADTVRASYERIGDGDFDRACALVLPEARTALARVGRTCQSELAREYDAAERAKIKDVDGDESRIDRTAAAATVPASAVRFGGQPSDDSSTVLVRSDGKWWVTLGD